MPTTPTSSAPGSTEAPYRIRPADEGDFDAMVALARTALGAGVLTSADYWRWKHHASPFGTSPAFVAVDQNDIPVGLRVFLRWRWRTGDRDIDAVRAVDTATHPDWRRRGIFRALTDRLVDAARDEGVAFVFNTPNDQSRPGYLKMGWRDVGRVPIRALPLRPARAASRLAAARLGHRTEVDGFTDDGSVAALLADPQLADVLAGLHADEPRLHTRLTPEFLRWRYHDIPGHTYRARWHFSGGEGGFVIARRRGRGGLDETAIACVGATPGAIGRRLARKALVELCGESESDYVIASSASGTPEAVVLAEGLFAPAPTSVGPRFVARPLLEATTVDPTRWESWRCQIGDFELF